MDHGDKGRWQGLSVIHSQPKTLSGADLTAHDSLISFTRLELNLLFQLYGQNVATGEWRDYALDCLKERAVFSIFRRSGEMPLYRIEKNPQLARRQGAFSIITTTGLIVKRGHDLGRVISVLAKKINLITT